MGAIPSGCVVPSSGDNCCRDHASRDDIGEEDISLVLLEDISLVSAAHNGLVKAERSTKKASSWTPNDKSAAHVKSVGFGLDSDSQASQQRHSGSSAFDIDKAMNAAFASAPVSQFAMERFWSGQKDGKPKMKGLMRLNQCGLEEAIESGNVRDWGDSLKNLREEYLERCQSRDTAETERRTLRISMSPEEAKFFSMQNLDEQLDRQTSPAEDSAMSVAKRLAFQNRKSVSSVDVAPKKDKKLDFVGVESESDCDDDRKKSPKGTFRNLRRSKSLMNIIGQQPSMALQLIVENPRDIRSIYKLDKKELGHGSFGSVRQGVVKVSGAIRAVKSISKERMADTLRLLKMELKITKLVDHPNVISLYEIFEDALNIHLVMELCAGGHLQDRVNLERGVKRAGGLDDKRAAICMKQILVAIQYMHNQQIAHRDLKPENVLITDKGPIGTTSLKVSDFGVSCIFKPGQVLTARVGTNAFMSPQVIEKKYTCNCDIWAAGVIAFFVLSGYFPFTGADSKEIYSAVTKGKADWIMSEWVNATNDAMNFVKMLLTYEEKARPTATQALSDRWLSGHELRKNVALPHTLLTDLRTFRETNKLKKAALCMIARLLSAEQMEKYRDMYLACDIEGDGIVSVAKVRARLRQDVQKQSKLKSKERNMLLKKFEKDSEGVSGDISYTEFLAALMDKEFYTSEQCCRAAFEAFDHNGDGMICAQELESGEILGQLSTSEIRKIIQALDINQDGEVDFEEFTQMMKGN